MSDDSNPAQPLDDEQLDGVAAAGKLTAASHTTEMFPPLVTDLKPAKPSPVPIPYPSVPSAD